MAKHKGPGKRVTWAHSKKPQAMKEEAGRLVAEGKSFTEVAMVLGVGKKIVPAMLADSVFYKAWKQKLESDAHLSVQNLRQRLRREAPGFIDAIHDAIKNRKQATIRAKVAMWGLEATQVAVRREEQDVSHHLDFLAGRTTEEKEFFAVNGYWPNPRPGPDEPEPEEPEEEELGAFDKRH